MNVASKLLAYIALAASLTLGFAVTGHAQLFGGSGIFSSVYMSDPGQQ